MKRFASDRVASLMERMGLEEDVPIESRLVSKTIESAQGRVEGFNFDIRKRVVEFDDVINKQRETIYAERDKVLRNEDLTETIRQFLDDEIEAMMARYAGSDLPDDWNLEGLAAALRAMGLEGTGTTERRARGTSAGARPSREHLRELAETALTEKEAQVGESTGRIVERLVLLRGIDALWVEHLTELDDMRRGIGLRGYAQQDPLNEFRKEAYSLYEELRGLISHQVATTIFRVSVTRTAPQPMPMPFATPAGTVTGAGSGGRATMRSGAPATSAGGGAAGAGGALAGGAAAAGAAPAALAAAGAASPAGAPGSMLASGVARGLPMGPTVRGVRKSLGDQAVSSGGPGTRPGFTPSGQRIGRNDPCWCGSGQKYKKCHGR